jgi:hypothetical protein
MSVERKDESGLDGLGGLAVRREEVVDVGAGHVDQVLVVHVLSVVLHGIKDLFLFAQNKNSIW